MGFLDRFKRDTTPQLTPQPESEQLTPLSFVSDVKALQQQSYAKELPPGVEKNPNHAFEWIVNGETFDVMTAHAPQWSTDSISFAAGSGVVGISRKASIVDNKFVAKVYQDNLVVGTATVEGLRGDEVVLSDTTGAFAENEQLSRLMGQKLTMFHEAAGRAHEFVNQRQLDQEREKAQRAQEQAAIQEQTKNKLLASLSPLDSNMETAPSLDNIDSGPGQRTQGIESI